MAFQSMAEGTLNDLHSCADSCMDSEAAASTTTAVDPIRRDAAWQVDKMERDRVRILQEVAASSTASESSSSSSDSCHLPFCVATEEGTLTDLVVLDGPLAPCEGTVEPILSSSNNPSTSFASPSQSNKTKIHDDHHQPYQATFDDRGALFFDLDTFEPGFSSETDYQSALDHEAERRAALEHDEMKRKEQSILQRAEAVATSIPQPSV